MIQVTSPYKVVPLGISNVRSYWTAANNPFVFSCKRRDFEVFSVSLPTGSGVFRILTSLGSFTTADIGTKLYFNSGQYNGAYEISNVYISPVAVSVEVLGDWLGTTSNGYVNKLAYTNYYVEFVATIVVDGVTYNETIRKVPNADGTFSIDMSSIVTKYLKKKNERPYDGTLNLKDTALCGYVQLKYRTVYTYQGSTVTSSYSLVDGNSPFYFVDGALQFGSATDSNMQDYVPLWGNDSLSSTEPDVSNEALFLNKFTRLKYWEGWPFDLSFIYSEALHGQQVQKVELFKDVNGGSVGAGSSFYDLDSAGLEFVNSLALLGTYSTAVSYVQVYLRINNSGDDALTAPTTYQSIPRKATGSNLVQAQNLPITSPYAVDYADGYYQQYSGTTNDLRITEIATIDVIQCTYSNPFYLCWLNSVGGYSYYMFDINQTYSTEASVDVQFSKYYEQLSTTEREVFDLKRTTSETYSLIATNVSKADINALKEMYSSRVVYKLEQDGSRTRVLIPSISVGLYETNQPNGTFEVEVIMPKVL